MANAKMILHEFSQKWDLPVPTYEHETSGAGHESSWRSTVTLGRSGPLGRGQKFQGTWVSDKKTANTSAAETALASGILTKLSDELKDPKPQISRSNRPGSLPQDAITPSTTAINHSIDPRSPDISNHDLCLIVSHQYYHDGCLKLFDHGMTGVDIYHLCCADPINKDQEQFLKSESSSNWRWFPTSKDNNLSHQSIIDVGLILVLTHLVREQKYKGYFCIGSCHISNALGHIANSCFNENQSSSPVQGQYLQLKSYPTVDQFIADNPHHHRQ